MIERKTFSRKLFIVFNYFFCILIGLACIAPVIHTVALSFSSIDAVFSNHVSFWPIGFNYDNYNIINKISTVDTNRPTKSA